MKRLLQGVISGLSVCTVWIGGFPPPAFAEVYKYQDAQGRWQYTDRPRPGASPSEAVLPTPAVPSGPPRDLNAALRARFAPQTSVQEATLSTVTIQTPLGVGSGFFISHVGHVLTNQHVIKLPESARMAIQQALDEAEQALERRRQRLTWRERELNEFRQELDQYAAALRTGPEGAGKAARQAYYQSRQDQYQTLQQELADQHRKLRAAETEQTTERRALDWKRAVAGVRTTFTIQVKDGTELTAALVAVSATHDLALLKVDGYRTPALRPAALHDVRQGVSVYAIGSPLGLKDSISAGVVSGLDSGFLRTDAKIYPGNSGGPLILSDGRVIGINTMKAITEKFEGIGYAIPIDTALQEFARDLSGALENRLQGKP